VTGLPVSTLFPTRRSSDLALLVLALVGLMRWAVGGALRAAAAWELSPRAPEARVEAWIDQRLPGWADLATLDLVGLVLLNVAALLPLVAYLRSGIDFYFGFPFALGVVLLLGVVVLSGGWAGVATLVVVGPPLWRTGRAHDRARFAALGEGRRPRSEERRVGRGGRARCAP